MSSVLITTGEYFNDQLLEDYENLSILDYGNYSDSSGYNYNETEFDDLSSQLESNPIFIGDRFCFPNILKIYSLEYPII